jgi:ribosomal protein S18 acetylase RimI-like enzyme
MTLSIEPATPADAEIMVKVQIAAFHNDAKLYPGLPLDGPPGYNSVDTFLKKLEECDYYKIVVDGQIVGGMTVYDMGEGHFHLDLIYIDPAYHNRGIGTQAMHFIEKAHAAQKWTLHTPGYAIRNQHFYEKFGYVKIGEETYPDIVLIAYEKQQNNE